jgi:dolichyl-phosphate beta-glucosyltransferase
MISQPDWSNGEAAAVRVSIIVPCYNEASRLDVSRFHQFLAENTKTRILFVDDGSRDETALVLEKLCHGYERYAELLRLDRNRGKAEAVRFGINHVLSKYEQEMIGYWDADLATPLESIDRFVRVLDERPEIEMVFGARVKLLGRYVKRRAVRHYLGRIFATVVSITLGLAIYDTQCGAKLFRVKPELKQVFGQPFLSKWVFDVEILARYLNIHKADRKHLEQIIYEYPLETWVDIGGSKVRPKDFFVAFWDIVRIGRKYLW